mgnify:CR=1 FL=1|jgi:anti-sigma-K factor RskA
MERENRQFEQDLSAEERQIDDLLFDAMYEPVPEGLSDRIATASTNALLEGQLDVALKVHISAELSQRVFAASVSSLQDSPAVIGRVGHTVVWRQVAMAACVIFAVLVAIRFGTQSSQQQSQPFVDRTLVAVLDTDILSVEEEGLLLEDLDLTEFDYLSDTRELAFADVAESMNSLRNDLELWQYGLLGE